MFIDPSLGDHLVGGRPFQIYFYVNFTDEN